MREECSVSKSPLSVLDRSSTRSAPKRPGGRAAWHPVDPVGSFPRAPRWAARVPVTLSPRTIRVRNVLGKICRG